MLSCKNCGAQMSGIDLVCKNCGTPWGKKHKGRAGMYISIFIIIIIAMISCIIYIPGAKDVAFNLYNKILAVELKNNSEKIVEPNNENIDTKLPNDNSAVTPPLQEVKEQNEVKEPSQTDQPPKPQLPPNFTWVSSSSFLEGYGPELTIDGKLETTWLEGVKGNGIGENITYSAEADQTVSSITLYNGYLKNDKVYINNGRIKTLSVEFSDGEIITKDIPKTQYLEAKKGYTIKLDNSKTTTFVKLTILDAYQGAYYTDTGFSGISFN